MDPPGHTTFLYLQELNRGDLLLGHTVFLYLQELNRAELQKQAKLYGIKANQKSEVLRHKLKRVLSEKRNIKPPTQSVVVVKEEKTIDVDDSIVEDISEEREQKVEVVDNEVVTKEEENAVLTVEQQDKESEQPEEKVVGEVEGAHQEEDEFMDFTQHEMENEDPADAPLQVVIVNTDSNEMVDLADESIASPTTAAKEIFRSKKLPSGPLSKKSRHALDERFMNAKSSNHTTKLGKPQRNIQPSNLSKIIRTNYSTTRPAQSKITQKPTLVTQTNPKPKQMALSRRNELQLKKFIERQNRGRKKREEQLQRAHIVTEGGRKALVLTVEQEDKELERPEEKVDGEVERAQQEDDELMDVTQHEMENEDPADAPLQVVIVNTDSNEMADLADESLASPTTKPSNSTTKLGKPQRHFQPSNISKIIRTKNCTTRPAQSKITRNPTRVIQTYPKPKQMALTQRNELQLQKFIERQNRGRKKREEQQQRAEFANLVRSWPSRPSV